MNERAPCPLGPCAAILEAKDDAARENTTGREARGRAMEQTKAKDELLGKLRGLLPLLRREYDVRSLGCLAPTFAASMTRTAI